MVDIASYHFRQFSFSHIEDITQRREDINFISSGDNILASDLYFYGNSSTIISNADDSNDNNVDDDYVVVRNDYDDDDDVDYNDVTADCF